MTTEFRWHPSRRATAERSWITAFAANCRQAAIIGSGSSRPSAIALFSSTV
jgi:hypothetical protein